jgi:hypothetical protein
MAIALLMTLTAPAAATVTQQDFDEFTKRLTSLAEYYERSYGDAVSIDLDKEIAYYRQVRHLLHTTTFTAILCSGLWCYSTQVLRALLRRRRVR